MQAEIAKVEEWCKKWYVTLSPIKSKLILFTKCPRHKDEAANNYNIKLFNESITLAEEAEFLGVKFDCRLTWEPQIQKIVAKAYKRLNLLRAISAQAEKINPNVMAKLYMATIRSIFEYCSVCIINAAETHLQKLQLIQNQALRVIMRTPAYVAIDDLHDCSGLPRIKEHLIKFAQRRFASMERSSPLIEKTIEEYKQVRHITTNASALDVMNS